MTSRFADLNHRYLITSISLSVFVTVITAVILLWKAEFNTGNLLFVGRAFKADRYWDNLPLYQDGYDGQFYYYIAKNPFDIDYLSKVLDSATYRYRRIFYPLVVWGLSLGGSINIPLTMFIVNAAIIPVVAMLMALILIHSRVSDRLAYYCCAFSPSLLFALKYSLSEGLGAALVLLGVYLYLKSRHTQAAMALLLAGFTRETYILVPGVILLTEFVYRRRLIWQYYVSGCLYAVFWMCVPLLFRVSLGNDGRVFSSNFSLLGHEASGLLSSLMKALQSGGGIFSYTFIVVIFVVYILRYLIFIVRQASVSPLSLFSALGLLFGLIALSYGKNIWNITSGPESFIRVSDLFIIFSFLTYSTARTNRKEMLFMPVLYGLVLMYFFQMDDIGVYDFR